MILSVYRVAIFTLQGFFLSATSSLQLKLVVGVTSTGEGILLRLKNESPDGTDNDLHGDTAVGVLHKISFSNVTNCCIKLKLGEISCFRDLTNSKAVFRSRFSLYMI